VTAVRGLFSGNITSYRYQALPGETTELPPQQRQRNAGPGGSSRGEEDGTPAPDTARGRHLLKIMMVALLVGLLGFLIFAFS